MALVRLSNGQRLEENTAAAFQRADAEMAQRTGEHIDLRSGYRDASVQAGLYKKYHGIKAVAKPGHSNHQRGTAIDVHNWDKAKPFLEKNGFNWPNLWNDKAHFDYKGPHTQAKGTDENKLGERPRVAQNAPSGSENKYAETNHKKGETPGQAASNPGETSPFSFADSFFNGKGSSGNEAQVPDAAGGEANGSSFGQMFNNLGNIMSQVNRLFNLGSEQSV